MSTKIKRHNHKVHTCEAPKKQDLLKHLIEFYADKTILVISKSNTSTTHIPEKNLTLTNDSLLSELKDEKFDVLISFDLPSDVDVYTTRLTYAKTTALIIVTPAEETLLYPIDMHLGKNLPREIVKGFELRLQAKPKNAPHRPTKAQVAEEEAQKQEVRAKQDKIREWAAKRGEEASAEELKKVEDDATRFLKDTNADKKEGDRPSLGKKDWDKKPVKRTSSGRIPKKIKIPAKKAK